MTTAETSKRWFELECGHCGQRFIEMTKLVFHRCPGQGNARRARRNHLLKPAPSRQER